MFCAQRQFERRICRQTRRISHIVFLVVRKLLSEVAKQELHRRRPKTDLRIVQSDHSFRTNKSERPIKAFNTDLTSVQTNQIYPTDLLSVWTNQIFPTDLLTYRPIRFILRTYFLTDQSDLSYVPTFRTDQSDLS